MTRIEALHIDVSVLRFAVAQLIANNCSKEADPEDALRQFSEQLYKRIETGPVPDSLQDIMALMSKGVDNLITGAQEALKF
jgi:hypothetical protein